VVAVRRRRDIGQWSDEDVVANVLAVYAREVQTRVVPAGSHPLRLYRVAIVLHRNPAWVPKRLRHLPPYMCFMVQGTPESAGWNSHFDPAGALDEARDWVGPECEQRSVEDLDDTVRAVFFRMVRNADSVSDFVFS
jgi:hypothetical protein